MRKWNKWVSLGLAMQMRCMMTGKRLMQMHEKDKERLCDNWEILH